MNIIEAYANRKGTDFTGLLTGEEIRARATKTMGLAVIDLRSGRCENIFALELVEYAETFDGNARHFAAMHYANFDWHGIKTPGNLPDYVFILGRYEEDHPVDAP